MCQEDYVVPRSIACPLAQIEAERPKAWSEPPSFSLPDTL
jgi:hypothetical protein